MEWELDCSNQVTPSLKLEQLCLEHGLVIRSKGTLGKYPGSVHWHFEKPSTKGILEATYWNGRLWLQVRSNRQGDWTTSIANSIQKAFIG